MVVKKNSSAVADSLLFMHCHEIVTNEGVVKKEGIQVQESDLGIIHDGALVWDRKKGVSWLGASNELPKRYFPLLKSKKSFRDGTGRTLTPALVDCHTHLVFAGSRYNEFHLRLQGASYQEIAEKGGGIVSSVRDLRNATHGELFETARVRVEMMLKLGVGVIEVKSGYGLTHESEIKILEVVQKLKRHFKGRAVFRITYLGAHAFPPEAKDKESRSAYVQEIIKKTLPEIARKKLADACDVFFDKGYFNAAEAKAILSTAKKLGLEVKLHADELADTGGAALAAEMGALSADHLLRANQVGLRKMAEKKVVAVLLPTTAFYLKIPYASYIAMKDVNLCVALASDYNPGSSPSFHLPFVMTLACLNMGMKMHEAFSAVTYGGARALGLHRQHGFIAVGHRPALAFFNCPSYQSLIAEMTHPGFCTELLV